MASAGRAISRQECSLQLNNKHGYHKLSLPVKLVSLSGEKSLDLNKLDQPDAKITRTTSMAEAYWKRETDENFLAAVALYEENPIAWKAMAHPNYRSPKHPREVSLHNFVAFFNEKWVLQKREHIPCFSPRLIKVPRSSNKVFYEMFCRTRLLQFKPGATPTNLLSEGQETYAKAMDAFVFGECPSLVREDDFKTSS